MPKKKPNSFKNYYKMSTKELENYIEKIRLWLFNNPKNKQYQRVTQALDIALNAKELKTDENVQDLIDSIT